MIHFFQQFTPGVSAAFSDREFEASKDLRPLLKTLGTDPERFCDLEQVHADHVILAKKPFNRLQGDGLVTREKGLALVIRSADCASVFFFDPKTKSIGICHAGWRGIKRGIIPNTVQMLEKEFGSKPASLQVAIGPAICPKCYEVGDEFESYFPKEVSRLGKKYFFDLKGAAKRQLIESGVAVGAINDPHLCTACSADRFFSARREGNETGRLLSAIVLK